jgi:hypothetical protein
MNIEGRNNPFEAPEEETERIDIITPEDVNISDAQNDTTDRVSFFGIGDEDTEEVVLPKERIPKKYLDVIHEEASAWGTALFDRGWTREDYVELLDKEEMAEAQFRLAEDTNARLYLGRDPKMNIIFLAKDLSSDDKEWCIDLFDELVLSRLGVREK